jgi:hypothetical protein
LDAIQEVADILNYRDYWPNILLVVDNAIQAVARNQPLLSGSENDLKRLLEIPRAERQVVYVKQIESAYHEDVTNVPLEQAGPSGIRGGGAYGAPMLTGQPGQPGQAGRAGTGDQARRGYILTLRASTPIPRQRVINTGFATRIRQELEAQSEKFEELEMSETSVNYEGDGPGSPGAGRAAPPGRTGDTDEPTVVDPLTGEDAGRDTHFRIRVRIELLDPDEVRENQRRAREEVAGADGVTP